MAEPDFVLKRGDRTPALTATLQDVNGTAVNLTTATSVRFLLRPSRGGTAVATAATIVTAASGTVRHDWPATTPDAGSYQGEFEVTWTGGLLQSFPSDGYLWIVVLSDLA